MEKETGYKVRLGLFVSIGIALLITGVYMIGKKQNLFSSTFQLNAVFHNVNGLQIGNNVRFSGISIGTVDNIRITSDSTVLVELIIQEGTRKFIKKDAKALIGSEGLMGNKIVNIVPGGASTEPIKPNSYIQTSKPMDIDEIMQSVKITADNAAIITTNLANITTNLSKGKGTIGKLFYDTAFAKNLDRTIVNLKSGAEGLNHNMEAAKHSFLLKPSIFGGKTKVEKEEEKQEKQKEKEIEKLEKEKHKQEKRLEKEKEEEGKK